MGNLQNFGRDFAPHTGGMNLPKTNYDNKTHKNDANTLS